MIAQKETKIRCSIVDVYFFVITKLDGALEENMWRLYIGSHVDLMAMTMKAMQVSAVCAAHAIN